LKREDCRSFPFYRFVSCLPLFLCLFASLSLFYFLAVLPSLLPLFSHFKRLSFYWMLAEKKEWLVMGVGKG
jgi:hypothetical protein